MPADIATEKDQVIIDLYTDVEKLQKLIDERTLGMDATLQLVKLRNGLNLVLDLLQKDKTT